MQRLAPLACVGFLIAAAPVLAQDRLPSSTNPAERVTYRGDKSVQDEQAAQLMCYQWSSEQTTFDPEQAYATLESEYSDAMAQYNSTRGSAVGGAARGALAGLAIGAIAGDAGQGAAIGAAAGGIGGGARGRRARAGAQEQFQAAVNEFRTNFRAWDSHWVACMIGNGYGVG